MRREQKNIFKSMDWWLVSLYLILVFLGWINIYAAVYNDDFTSIFSMSQNYGKQLVWILTSFLLAAGILIVDVKFFAAFAYPVYGFIILLLILVLILGDVVSGSKSWFEIGSVKIQPAEFAKFATNLAVAKYLSTLNIDIRDLRTRINTVLFLLCPMALILLQNDTGSALVYISFILVLYREGLSGKILWYGFLGAVLFILTLTVEKGYILAGLAAVAVFFSFIYRKKIRQVYLTLLLCIAAAALVFSVNYVFDNVLAPHQKQRINVLLGKEIDLKGAGYNVNQSKIAIGSGGLFGKGFLQGTQTKFNFVPEQSTDFIFCTVGEEWGFAGSITVLTLMLFLLIRIIFVAEKQRSAFTRIYGYGVASILFMHLSINIGMALGLLPVIGIPLPFFSYGGSSLWSFTILLFIFIKLDSNRMFILR